MRGEISINVEEANALSRPASVLVLKYAQHLFGVDMAAVQKIGLDEATLPAPDHHLLAAGKPAVMADQILFVGTQPIGLFDYRTIRQFSKRALSVLAVVLPQTQDVCLTLHGAGFGLDEIEAFESEVAGLIDAISAGTYPSELRTVTFLELDEHRAARMKVALQRLVPHGHIEVVRPFGPESVEAGVADHLRSVGFDSGTKAHAFVAMPFANKFDDIFYYGIAPPIREAGLLCERMDKIAFTGDIGVHMKDRIGNAKFVVADLTGANPNVNLEVGYSWGRGVPTILICDQSAQLEFDVQSHRCLLYSSIRDLEAKLITEIGLLRRAGVVQ